DSTRARASRSADEARVEHRERRAAAEAVAAAAVGAPGTELAPAFRTAAGTRTGTEGAETKNESGGAIRSSPGHDGAAHDRDRRLRRRVVSATAGERSADGGLPDDQRRREPPRRESADHGGHGRHATRESVLRDRRH